MADHDLSRRLHALVAQMMIEAQEADADGDFCCALTRRYDAIAVLGVIAEWRINRSEDSTDAAQTWQLTQNDLAQHRD